jgi:heat shock protein beta
VSPADENASPTIVDKYVGGAIPDALSTNANVAQRESESISRKSLQVNTQKFEFRAEVSRMHVFAQ